jgi:hypothetical protein
MIRVFFLASRGLEAGREELELAQGRPPAHLEGGAGAASSRQAGDEMDALLAPQGLGRASLPFP